MKNKTGKNSFLGGAVILTASVTLSKIMGMLYRLPLAKTLGSFGLGLYQTVFPIYALLVCVGSSAVTTAVSRCVAEHTAERNALKVKGTLKSATLFSFAFTFLSALALFIFSPEISALQGVSEATLLYKCIAPSIVFAGLSGVIRGYFQGQMNMTPTALSEIVFQSAKPLFALTFSSFFSDAYKKAVFAVLSVTFGELLSLILLSATFLCEVKSKPFPCGYAEKEKGFYSVLLPVTLSGVLLPLSNATDSFWVINSLKNYTEHAVGLYGTFTGVCLTVLSVPASLSYGLAVAVLPSLSALLKRGEKDKAKKGEYVALTLTVYVSLPITAFLYLFAPNVISLLFRTGNAHEFGVLVKMIKLASPYAVFLPVLQTANAVLYGKGKGAFAPVAVIIGLFFKIAVMSVLLKSPSLNIFGYIIAVDVCYILAVFVDLVYIIREIGFVVFVLKTAVVSAIAVYTGYAVYAYLGFFVACVLAVTVYFGGTVAFKLYGKEEIGFLTGKLKGNERNATRNVKNR